MRTVFFDLETGGLRPEHPVIQLSAVAVDEDWNELLVFDEKIRFDEDACDPVALQINNYEPTAWAEAKSPTRVVGLFYSWLHQFKDVTLISRNTGNPYNVARVGGHNVCGFDLERLQRLFNQNGGQFLPVQLNAPLDTLQGSVWYCQKHGLKPKDFKLGTLLDFFGLKREGTAHEALSDVRASISIAKHILTAGA